MEGFGYGILKALVTDIDPDAKVKESMNEINAAQRMRVAATERGEADRILKVKSAEGDAQSKALQGRGIADQRQAIVAGLRDSVDEFRKSVPGTTAKDVMNLVLMTQYFDMLKEIGASSRTNAILIPHSPGNLTTLTEQMRNAMMEADQTVRASDSMRWRPPRWRRTSLASCTAPDASQHRAPQGILAGLMPRARRRKHIMDKEQYNEDLSYRRASAVQDYLTARNLNKTRMPISSMGERCQLVPESTRELNRRVDFHRLQTGESCPMDCSD
jgi:hypothetical protein